jgi:dihydroorotate dehydrogenase (NAD+) catalytic subunit
MVGSQNLVDPYACKKIIDDLPKVMKKYNIEKLEDIIGGAK